MYRLSQLTGEIYFNNVRIIQDDRLQEWNDFVEYMNNGGELLEIESTPEEIAQANKTIVPDKVTAIQFIAQLSFEGISEANIMAVIDTLNEPDRTVAKVSYNRAVYFERANPFISLIGQAFNKSEDDLDNIFINASKIW